jgi:hypothetical protein
VDEIAARTARLFPGAEGAAYAWARLAAWQREQGKADLAARWDERARHGGTAFAANPRRDLAAEVDARLPFVLGALLGAVLIAFAVGLRRGGTTRTQTGPAARLPVPRPSDLAIILVPLLVALALSPLTRPRRVLLAGLMLLAGACTYLGLYGVGLAMAGAPASVANVVAQTQRLLAQHAGATEMKNPWVSGWPTWALPRRALVLGFDERDGLVRALSCLGNLATWWAAVALSLLLGWRIAVRGLAATCAPSPARAEAEDGSVTLSPGVFLAAHGRAVVLLLSGALAFLAPWVLTHRDSYLYHFLPSYTALVLLLGAWLGWANARRPRVVLAFLAVVLLVAGFYAPVWSYLPLSRAGFEQRLFLESWR